MQNVAASCRLITEDTQVVVAASINDEADDDTDDGPDDQMTQRRRTIQKSRDFLYTTQPCINIGDPQFV